jgi:cytochrome oxidase Cu insertion factor (SCO1/SenC/PrrC family)
MPKPPPKKPKTSGKKTPKAASRLDAAKSAQVKTTGAERPKAAGRPLVVGLLLTGIVLLVVAPVAALKLAAWKIRHNEAVQNVTLQPAEEPKFGGPFTLVDQNGATVTDATYRGKYLLVYFGYTYCPDLCPTALQNITETLDELGPDADRIQALFITIDPARDTPAKLKEYTASFHPGIIGLTGSSAQIAAVAKAYHVTYSKAENVDDDDYIMDHSTFVYIVDPDGKPVTSMNMEDIDPEAMADQFRRLWKSANSPRS